MLLLMHNYFGISYILCRVSRKETLLLTYPLSSRCRRASLTVLSGRSVFAANSFCVNEPSYSNVFNKSFELGGMFRRSSASFTFLVNADTVVESFLIRIIFAGIGNLVHATI